MKKEFSSKKEQVFKVFGAFNVDWFDFKENTLEHKVEFYIPQDCPTPMSELFDALRPIYPAPWDVKVFNSLVISHGVECSPVLTSEQIQANAFGTPETESDRVVRKVGEQIEKFAYDQGWRFKERSTPSTTDNVAHPSHYNSGKIEVIEFIEDQQLNFPRGNAVKYISRAGKKDATKEIEDLRKAVWYLKREIECLEAVKTGREKIRPNEMEK